MHTLATLLRICATVKAGLADLYMTYRAAERTDTCWFVGLSLAGIQSYKGIRGCEAVSVHSPRLGHTNLGAGSDRLTAGILSRISVLRSLIH